MLAVNLCVFEGIAKVVESPEGTSFKVVCNGEEFPVYSEDKANVEDGKECRVIGRLANDGSFYVSAISIIMLE